MRNLILILILFYPLFLIAEENPTLYVYQDENCKEKVGVISKNQLKKLVDTTEKYTELEKAEREGRLKLFTDIKIWEIDTDKPFKTNVHVQWWDKDKKIIKELKFEMTLYTKSSNMNQYRVWYRDVAEIIAPVLFLLLLIP